MEKQKVDSELKKAFLELQIKVIESNKKIKDIDQKITTLKHLQNQVITNALGISYLPNNTKTYEAIGRMFLRKDMGKLKRNLAEQEADLKTLIGENNENKTYLKKNLEESEDYAREMVKLRKNLMDTE